MLQLLKSIDTDNERIWSLNFSSNQLWCSGSDQVIRSYSLSSFDPIHKVSGHHQRTVRCIDSFHNYLATASFDSTCALFEISKDECDCIATLEGHENEVKSVAFSSDGQLIATCGRDKSVWVWAVLDDCEFECVAVLQEHTQDVKCVKWHPNEELLASCSYDDSIRLWREEQDEWFCLQILKGHASTVWAIDFSVCGNFLVSVSDDKTIRLWRKEREWDLVFTLDKVHERAIYSVSWSKSEPYYIATGSEDNSICLLEREGSELKLLHRIENAHKARDVNCVAWHKKYLASGGDDGCVKVWEMNK